MEPVHIELSNKRFKVPGFKHIPENLRFEQSLVLYQNGVTNVVPTDDVVRRLVMDHLVQLLQELWDIIFDLFSLHYLFYVLSYEIYFQTITIASKSYYLLMKS